MDVENVLKPVFYLSFFGGVDVDCFKGGKMRKNASYLRVVIFICILIANLIHFVLIPYGVYAKYGKIESFRINEHLITKTMNPMVVSGVAICSRVHILIKIGRKLPNLLKNLNEIHHFLETPLSKNERTKKRILIYILIILLISWPFQIFSVLRLQNNPFLHSIFFFNLFNNFSAFCCEFQFIVLTWIISSHFQQVCDKWKAIQLLIQHRYAGGAFSAPPMKTPDSALHQIRNVANCQILLFDACRALNDHYNIQLLLSLSTLFVNILLNVYFSIFGGYAEAHQHSDLATTSDVINNVIWSLYYAFRFVLICSSAESLAKWANSPKLHISVLLKNCPDQSVKDELWPALAHAALEKIQFTACNFLKINQSLITKAVATGTTYLVILAQFHKG